MPVYTGRNLTISINAVSYSGQVSVCRLVPTQNTNQYITLTTTTAKADPVTWTLEVTGFQDYATTTGISKNLYDAAATGTGITFSVGLPNSRTASGTVIPVFADIGGTSPDALEQTYSFPVDGSLTLT